MYLNELKDKDGKEEKEARETIVDHWWKWMMILNCIKEMLVN